MKILIPAAGQGSRFQQAGFTFPKPLIETHNHVPMIQRVVENLPFPEAEYIFLVRREHVEKYDMDTMLRTMLRGKSKGVQIIVVDKLTEGAACTALLAKEFIDNDEELLIANSDQVMEYEVENFNTLRRWSEIDALVFTFGSCDPKWSFVKLDENSKAIEVAEKKPISQVATCGVYYYRKGSDFVKYAEQMIEKNIRVKNEFYIAPVYNELIQDGKVLRPFFVHRMWGIGDPESLHVYMRDYGKG